MIIILQVFLEEILKYEFDFRIHLMCFQQGIKIMNIINIQGIKKYLIERAIHRQKYSF